MPFWQGASPRSPSLPTECLARLQASPPISPSPLSLSDPDSPPQPFTNIDSTDPVFKYPKLKGANNYKTWKEATELFAYSKDLHNYLTGAEAEVTKPNPTNIDPDQKTSLAATTLYNTWKRNDSKAKMMIFLSCEHDVQLQLEGYATAAQCWDKLKMFEVTGYAVLYEQLTSLVTLRLDHKGIETYCQRFQTLINTLNEVDCKIPHNAVTVLFLMNLGPGFETWASRKRSEIQGKKQDDLPSLSTLIAEAIEEARVHKTLSTSTLFASRSNPGNPKASGTPRPGPPDPASSEHQRLTLRKIEDCKKGKHFQHDKDNCF